MIPKVIYQIWLGDKIPKIQSAIIRLNRDMCKKQGFSYKLIRTRNITKSTFPQVFPYINKLLKLKDKSKYAQISDLLRYELLYNKGGIYADVGIELKNLKILNNFIYKANKSNKYLLLCHNDPEKYCKPFYCNWHGSRMQISNSFICSIPENEILGRLINTKKLKKLRLGRNNVNLQTGPYYFRSIMRNTNRNRITFIPTKYIFPFNWNQVVPYTQILYKSKNKCVSYTKPKVGKYVTSTDQCNNKIYVNLPCNKYKNVIGIKHWDVGGSWISKNFLNYECTRIKTL